MQRQQRYSKCCAFLISRHIFCTCTCSIMDPQEHATPAKQPRKRTKGLLKKLQEQVNLDADAVSYRLSWFTTPVNFARQDTS